MAKKIRLALLGSTGSIGRQTLEVLESLGGYEVVLLSAHSNWKLLAEQAVRWKPQLITITNEQAYDHLKPALSGHSFHIECGDDACTAALAELDYDIAVNALVGLSGLRPSYEVIRRGIDLALANKESLVLGGDLLNSLKADTGSKILPIDSEHSAIFQSLWGERVIDVKRLILTASGGPFLRRNASEFCNITKQEALKHPNWVMGSKVTIDSATLMNKGLEVIEAYHLFGIPMEKIEVRIHPVSIVHSMVQFVDGSFKAQLGRPDMRLPIQVALTYPYRAPMNFLSEDDPINWPPLQFEEIDTGKFPCLSLAYKAMQMGGTAPAMLNGADEVAVERFLDSEISFNDIPRIIDQVLSLNKPIPATSLEAVINADSIGREAALNYGSKVH